MSEGRVAGKVSGKEIPRRCEFVTDEAEPEKPGPHSVFRILVLLRFRACRSYILCHLRKGEAKLNVALELSCVDAAFAFGRRLVELEKSELNRAFGEGGVEVEHVVSAAVVVVVSAVVLSLASVPDVRKGRHRPRLSGIDLSEEVRVDRPAVMVHPVGVKLQRLGEKALVACHYVGEVPKRLRRVAVRPDVDVNSAASRGVALCAGLAKFSAKLLKKGNVIVVKDRRDHFTFAIVSALNGNVSLEFPLSTVGVPG